MTAKVDRDVKSIRFCAECCRAMAAAEVDDGEAFERREWRAPVPVDNSATPAPGASR